MFYSLMLALVLFDSTETKKGYSEAYRNSVNNNKPLVVVVGADWCPACVDVKKRIFPNLFKRFQVNQFYYAEVDLDKEPELASRLMSQKTKTIPQTVIFYRENNNWRIKRWIGSREVEVEFQPEIQRLTNE
jgi:glutaredoxin